MERRVLLAITLSFLVLFLFQRFVMPPSAPPASQSGATGDKPVAQSGPGNASAPPLASPNVSTGGTSPAPLAEQPAAPAAPETTVGEPAEREVIVETTTVRAVFSNRGARLLHWTLKGFRSDEGTPLDLVPQGAGPDAVKPFSLVVDDPAVSARLNNAIYRVSAGGAGGDKPLGVPDNVDATASPQSVVFEMAAVDGLSVKKTFSVEPGGYVIAFSTVVQLAQARLNPIIHWGAGLGDDIARSPPASFFSPSYNTPSQAIVYKEGSVERVPPTTSGSQEGAFRYAGIDDHYFLSVVINESAPAPFRIDYAPVHVAQADDPAIIGKYTAYAVKYQSPQDQVRFFLGPKAFDDLKTVDTELTRAINYGMFSWLAVPLLGALKWVYGFIGNWGWSIVVLTILINLAMFPLRHKSVVSMRKMQEIQPQMKAIQDRYAKYKVTDPERQKMNTEVMALYKSKGVNPASGCVPMLLTMPFLFAFYAMLSQSIEIRGAHFAGWIHNLSAPDPYFISPLIMGATMFWQQKMTPATMDPAQAKIMMFMPVMFTFMSLSFPSGLVIYWTVSNIWGIGQQYFTNYLIGGPSKPVVATKP